MNKTLNDKGSRIHPWGTPELPVRAGSHVSKYHNVIIVFLIYWNKSIFVCLHISAKIQLTAKNLLLNSTACWWLWYWFTCWRRKQERLAGVSVCVCVFEWNHWKLLSTSGSTTAPPYKHTKSLSAKVSKVQIKWWIVTKRYKSFNANILNSVLIN